MPHNGPKGQCGWTPHVDTEIPKLSTTVGYPGEMIAVKKKLLGY